MTAGAALICWASLASALGRANQDENAIKAAFLINFARYTEWPRSNSSGDLVIGVIGRTDVAEALEQLSKGRSVNGRSLKYRKLDWTSAQQGHIVYIAPGESGSYDKLSALHRSGVVTVGDTAGFALNSGHIGFRLQDERVAFEINPTRAKQAGITFSSRLLQLAKIVGGNK